MTLLFYLPLLIPALAAVAARPVAARLEPRAATWLLTVATAALAGCSTAALALLAASAAARAPLLAALGHYSPYMLRTGDPVSAWAGLLAAVALTGVAVAVAVAFRRRARALAESFRRAGRLPADGSVVVVPGPAIEAYALPGWPGRIVISGRLLSELDDDGRAALLAHEQAHLAARHHLFGTVARLAAAANPLLLPLARAVDYTVERWADESAARATGDRRLVAVTIGRVALLAARGPGRPADRRPGWAQFPGSSVRHDSSWSRADLGRLGRPGAAAGRRAARPAAAGPRRAAGRRRGGRPAGRCVRPGGGPGPACPAGAGSIGAVKGNAEVAGPPGPGCGLAAVAGLAERSLLLFVIAVAAAALARPAPGRAASARDGIDAALAVLVFATGLSLRLADLAAVRTAWRRVALALAVSTAVLPALAWAASQLIGDPVLRSGMQTVGVAPAEVATVALCVIAGGEVAVCAVILAASTLVTVLAAGPVLALAGAAGPVPAAGLLGTLLVVVALPLAAGVGLRAAWPPGARADAAVRIGTVLALLVLLWQVASQIRLDAGYLRVIAALAAIPGWVRAARRPAVGAAAGLPRGSRAAPGDDARLRRGGRASRPPRSARRRPPHWGSTGCLSWSLGR